MLEKEGSPFYVLGKNPSISINLISKKEFIGEYHEKERDKILNAIYFSDMVLSLLEPHLGENCLVGMEGLSFGSTGNSLIDISMTTALLRSALVKIIDPNNFFVISPTTLKKFAIKGNAKKFQMYDAIIETRKDDIRIKPLVDALVENKSKWVKESGKVEDPCSDIIDATWIALFVEENYGKLLKSKTV